MIPLLYPALGAAWILGSVGYIYMKEKGPKSSKITIMNCRTEIAKIKKMDDYLKDSMIPLTTSTTQVSHASFFNMNNKKDNEKQMIKKFTNEWINLMTNCKAYNTNKDTFSLNDIEITNFGVRCNIFVGLSGLTAEILESLTEKIESKYGCMLILNKSKRSKFVKAEFIFFAPEDLEFEIIKGLKPWEIYIGNDFSGKPIIVDMIKYPHILISGGTRSGKSKMSEAALVNLIVNTNKNTMNLYLGQVAKSDLIEFATIKQTKYFADTQDKILEMLEIIQEQMNERNALLKGMQERMDGDNFLDYMNIYKKTLPVIYVVFDEMSSIFESNAKGKAKEDNNKIVKYIENVAQYGASLGVFLFSSLQRPTANNLSPFVKAQSTLKVSLRQNNSKSAEVAIDDSKGPVGLNQREFVYSIADKLQYGIVPLISKPAIKEILSTQRENKNNVVDSSTIQEEVKAPITKKENKPSNNRKPLDKPVKETGSHKDFIKDKQAPVKKEGKKDIFSEEDDIFSKSNKKKPGADIEGFVEYEDHSDKNIINMTKISNKSEKPKKSNKNI